ncbi:MAG: lipid-A-disaccharide synthase [Paludibacteraceae bacterium]|nr:lipid-A-disaccharide synthase [Paludibacteraceae bacterium]
MKYFIVAGEASGDLHASNLMASLKKEDAQAEFCFLGGDLMQAQGGRMVRHYRDMAFMGIVSVVKNLDKVLNNLKGCQQELLAFRPDVVILVDYPSFNLKIAKFVKNKLKGIPVYYYISPKLWAWKEYRIKDMKKYVDRVYSILPFEVEYFRKHDFEVEYVGNPCVDAVENRAHKGESFAAFAARTGVEERPTIALLAGSRQQEIKSSLPIMLESASSFKDYQLVIAGAPSMTQADYEPLLSKYSAKVVFGETYELLQQAEVAAVTSGTATLETALLRTPQVVIYKMSGGKILHRILEKIIHVPFISLVNLIAGKGVVKELIIEEVTVANVRKELSLLFDSTVRERMLREYDELIALLGKEPVSDKAAKAIYARLMA